MKMKNAKMMLVAAVAALGTLVVCAGDGDMGRVVMQDVAEKAASAFKTAPIPDGEPVAILPIANDDDGWISGQLRTALTSAGKTCVIGAEDPLWKEILREIEWGTRKADILDPKTLTAFGKLKATRILLAANVRFASDTSRYSFAELEIQAVSIATRRILWGTTLSARKYKDDSKIVGLTKIPVQVRTVVLNKFRDGLADSLKRSAKAGTSVAVLPLSGDTDSYVANVVRDAVRMAGLVPVNLGATSLTEARFAVREQKEKCAGILYGAVRDLSATLVGTTPNSNTYRVDVEAQAVLEDAVTRAQQWSDTVSVSEDYTQTLGWWDLLCSWFPFLRAMPWLLVVVPLTIVLGLVVIGMFLRAMTRVR